jgi:hypothetical protein
MCILRCYFSTNSWIDWTERITLCYFSTNSWIDRTKRITLRWFRTLQQFLRLFSAMSYLRVNSPSHMWDFHMIQLCQHCWEIALVKVRTLGLVFKHCNTVYVLVYYWLPSVFIISDYKNLYLLYILHLFYHLFAELVHLYNLPLYWVCWGHKRFLVFDCRVAGERPSSTYASHGLINLRSSTWGKNCYYPTKPCAWGPNEGLREERLRSRHHSALAETIKLRACPCPSGSPILCTGGTIGESAPRAAWTSAWPAPGASVTSLFACKQVCSPF